MLNMKNVKELSLIIGGGSIEFIAATIGALAAQNALRKIRYNIIRQKYNRPKPLTKPLNK